MRGFLNVYRERWFLLRRPGSSEATAQANTGVGETAKLVAEVLAGKESLSGIVKLIGSLSTYDS